MADTLLDRLNELINRRHALKDMVASIKARYKKQVKQLKLKQAEQLAAVEQEITVVDRELRQLTDANRSRLMLKSKSTQLLSDSLSYRSQPERIEVVNDKLVLELAHKLHIVRKISKIVVSRSVVYDLLVAWLKKNPEHLDKFLKADAIRIIPEHEKLYIKSASGSIEIQSDKLSEPAIRVEGEETT